MARRESEAFAWRYEPRALPAENRCAVEPPSPPRAAAWKNAAGEWCIVGDERARLDLAEDVARIDAALAEFQEGPE